jgi:hypothetical protein
MANPKLTDAQRHAGHTPADHRAGDLQQDAEDSYTGGRGKSHSKSQRRQLTADDQRC